MAGPLTSVFRKRDLTSGSLAGNLFHLAAPLAVGAALHALYGIVDAFWLGRFGAHAITAPGVSLPFLFIVISLGMGFGHAGTPLVAQHTGAGRHQDAYHVAGQILLLLCVLAGVMALPAVVFAPQLLALARVKDGVAVIAVPYLRIVMLGIPLTALAIGYGSVLRALGNSITPVLIAVCSNIFNALLDPVLIFGLGGFPRLGATGAALATLASQVCAALVCLVLIKRRHAGLQIGAADLRPDWPVLGKTLRIGLPAAVANSANSIGFALYQAMVNELGPAVIAAFAIGFRVIHFFSIPGQAMAGAAAPVVGQALGAGKPALARRAVWVSVALVAAVMCVPCALLTWQRQLVGRGFVDDPDVIRETGRFFLIVPVSSYLFNVIMVLMAAFYGSGHTRPAMALALVRLWMIRLPAAYVLGFVLG